MLPCDQAKSPLSILKFVFHMIYFVQKQKYNNNNDSLALVKKKQKKHRFSPMHAGPTPASLYLYSKYWPHVRPAAVTH